MGGRWLVKREIISLREGIKGEECRRRRRRRGILRGGGGVSCDEKEEWGVVGMG